MILRNIPRNKPKVELRGKRLGGSLGPDALWPQEDFTQKVHPQLSPVLTQSIWHLENWAFEAKPRHAAYLTEQPRELTPYSPGLLFRPLASSPGAPCQEPHLRCDSGPGSTEEQVAHTGCHRLLPLDSKATLVGAAGPSRHPTHNVINISLFAKKPQEPVVSRESPRN